MDKVRMEAPAGEARVETVRSGMGGGAGSGSGGAAGGGNGGAAGAANPPPPLTGTTVNGTMKVTRGSRMGKLPAELRGSASRSHT